MNFKKTNFFTVIFFGIFLLSACAPVTNVAYFQKSNTNTIPVTNGKPVKSDLFEVRIKPKDLLIITVVTSEPSASRIYNLVVPQIDPSNQTQLISQPTLQTYLVDNDGTIDFPVIGKIKVAGSTRKQLEAELQAQIASAFSNERPIITIRFANFSVNILGEVLKPGKFETHNERLTIFDALALAGDMTIYGRRDNVKVLRENIDGTKKFITVNLNDENVVNSPVFYLEQNDVVYVEPNQAKTRSSSFGSAESFAVSAVSLVFSFASLLIYIIK